jgi:hypothetical protein
MRNGQGFWWGQNLKFRDEGAHGAGMPGLEIVRT